MTNVDKIAERFGKLLDGTVYESEKTVLDTLLRLAFQDSLFEKDRMEE